jgi:hypothetical protein
VKKLKFHTAMLQNKLTKLKIFGIGLLLGIGCNGAIATDSSAGTTDLQSKVKQVVDVFGVLKSQSSTEAQKEAAENEKNEIEKIIAENKKDLEQFRKTKSSCAAPLARGGFSGSLVIGKSDNGNNDERYNAICIYSGPLFTPEIKNFVKNAVRYHCSSGQAIPVQTGKRENAVHHNPSGQAIPLQSVKNFLKNAVRDRYPFGQAIPGKTRENFLKDAVRHRYPFGKVIVGKTREKFLKDAMRHRYPFGRAIAGKTGKRARYYQKRAPGKEENAGPHRSKTPFQQNKRHMPQFLIHRQ